jgi:uracil-DNA glycosylase family 4
MGFGLIDPSFKQQKQAGGVSTALLAKAECALCPLNNEIGLQHPKMKPAGSSEPDVYLLGQSPGRVEDDRGKPIAGDYWDVIRLYTPHKWLQRLRMNNVIRTRPPKDRPPAFTEIECCRPSIERDIARSEPLAIIGFGSTPLKWALRESRINQWRGRRAPAIIGGYPVWYFPLEHPQACLDTRRFDPRDDASYGGSQPEFAFARDLREAFRQIDAGLPKPIVHTREDAQRDCEVIDGRKGDEDLDHILYLLSELEHDEGDHGLDYETDGLRPYRDEAHILTASISTIECTFAFPFDHREAHWNERQKSELKKAWRRYLLKTKARKIAHALSFEMEWTAEFFGRDLLWNGEWADTQAQAFILDERPHEALSLDFLCIQYFGLHLKELSNVNRKKMADEPLDKILPYNCLDSKYARLLHPLQQARIKADGLMDAYLHHLERITACVLTQRKGIPINQAVVERIGGVYKRKRDQAEDEIVDTEWVGIFNRQLEREFNVGSTRDVVQMFKDIIGKPLDAKVNKKTGNVEDGKSDATEVALKRLKHPLADLIIEWREANKIWSTYAKPIREGSPHLFSDGHIHPVLSTMHTTTWRTASEAPNSQNYPKHGDGVEIREAMQREGYACVSFDYASIQARNVAMESYDDRLVKSFWDCYDIHTVWAEELYRRWPRMCSTKLFEEHKKKFRQTAKNKFVFPSFFGAKYKSICKGVSDDVNKVLHTNLKCPPEVIEDLQEHFFDQFPKIAKWHTKIEKQYYQTGYVTGHSGFHRRAPIAINQLINAPIQADESIIVLSSMIALSKLDIPPVQPNMEIHDDLTFFWPIKKVDQYAEIAIKELIKPRFDWINVPLVVEMNVGPHWNALKRRAEFHSNKITSSNPLGEFDPNASKAA